MTVDMKGEAKGAGKGKEKGKDMEALEADMDEDGEGVLERRVQLPGEAGKAVYVLSAGASATKKSGQAQSSSSPVQRGFGR